MHAVEVTLPGGIALEGNWHRTARLRPLCGRDEAFLEEEARFLPPASRTTHLLARCLDGLGPLTSVTESSIRKLTVGDRDALLLHLRRLTLGDLISCVITCPEPACREKMDLDINIKDLLFPAYSYESAIHETALAEDGERYRVRFRLPNGADQEAAVAVAFDDLEAAASLIMQRCVDEVMPERVVISPTTGAIPATVARKLPQVMADLDPQADILFDMNCPACQGSFTVPFDIADYFYRECVERRGNLYREVHLLAFHYHWSEAEIMAMTLHKRQLYLSLLSEALSGGRGR
jgi:hypothetical protein